MTEDDKAKAEKLAAAKKRVEQMKKKKKKNGTSSKAKENADTTPAADPEGEGDAEGGLSEAPPAESGAAADSEPKEPVDEKPAKGEDTDEPSSPSQPQPSLAQQSKMRSASFRQGSISIATGATPLSPGPFSPEGETATDIYRKHVARIEELEKENKRLAKEASDSEKRWKKAEDELADLREADGEGSGKQPGSDGAVERLRSQVASLERQNTQLQQQVSRSGAGRHASPPSGSAGGEPAIAELEAQVASKSTTIENMELELSKLRARLERNSADHEQISALEERLARSEKAAGLAQRELGDLRRNLDRTAEKAVREGSERTSAETKARSLEHDVADALAARLEAEKKADGLEKKVATLTTLHKEQDARMQALRRDKERAEKEAKDVKRKVESLESETTRLRGRKSTDGGGGLDDDGVDELENEERLRLERKVRELESEVHELRRGVWQEKRRELSGGHGPASPGGVFQDVDLGGASAPGGRKYSHQHHPHHGGGIGDLLQSGLSALTGQPPEDEGFLDDDEDMDFDEDAFRRAQQEDAMARVERIKEVKRGLKNWEGWRLDLVDIRRGTDEGIGDIFEV